MAQPYVLIPATGSDPADEWLRLGVESQVKGNLPEAQQRYQQALRLDPRHAAATQNLAVVFAQSNMMNEALLTIERACLFDGVTPMIAANRSLMSLEADRIDVAVSEAERAYKLEANSFTRLVLAMANTTAGHANKSIPLYNEILDSEPKHAAAGPNSCFVQTLTDASPADLLAQRKRWYEANRYTGQIEPHTNDRNPNRTLRVGYVGGDFKQHSAAFIFARVLLHHTSDVEMYLYSSLPVDAAADNRTKQFQEVTGDRWRDVSSMSDEDADRLIRKDKIDILVDLAAHTNGGRLTLFTRKPAPVQVTAWGFAHGSGVPEIDYFFADPIAVPENERQHFAEKIIDLPCIITIEPPEEYAIKETSEPPFRRNGVITLGCYTRFEKLSDECLRAFAESLRRVPDARFQFKDHAMRRPYAIRRVMSFMDGVEPERLLFSLATSHPDHILSYQQCDLACDPFWHGGGVVALEQLWAGVPLITMHGPQPSGRSASSVLTQMGRTDWIATSPEEYVEKIVEWCGRTKELSDARKTLRRELLESPVYKDYNLAVERAYQEIWRTYCNGE